MAVTKSFSRLPASLREAFQGYPLPGGAFWEKPLPSDLPWEPRESYAAISLGSLCAGFRFDQSNFVLSLLRAYNISPGQLVPNSWRTILSLGYWINDLGDIPLFTPAMFSAIFSLNKAPRSSFYYYLALRTPWRKLFSRTDESDDDWKSHWCWVRFSGPCPFPSIWNSNPAQVTGVLSPVERHYLYVLRYRLMTLGSLSINALSSVDECRRADYPCGLPGQEVQLPDPLPSLVSLFPALSSVIEQELTLFSVPGAQSRKRSAPASSSVPDPVPSSRLRVKRVARRSRELSLVVSSSSPVPEVEPVNVSRSPSASPVQVTSGEDVSCSSSSAASSDTEEAIGHPSSGEGASGAPDPDAVAPMEARGEGPSDQPIFAESSGSLTGPSRDPASTVDLAQVAVGPQDVTGGEAMVMIPGTRDGELRSRAAVGEIPGPSEVFTGPSRGSVPDLGGSGASPVEPRGENVDQVAAPISSAGSDLRPSRLASISRFLLPSSSFFFFFF